jgi:hypothetical protein
VKYFSIPTWLIANAAIPFFRKDHPWKKYGCFTLQHWSEHETELSKEFDLAFWLCFIGIAFIMWQLYTLT